MRHLGLQNTGLTDAGVKNLAGMPHLRWLGISKLPLSPTLRSVERARICTAELTSIELMLGTKISDTGLARCGCAQCRLVVDLNWMQATTGLSDRRLQEPPGGDLRLRRV